MPLVPASGPTRVTKTGHSFGRMRTCLLLPLCLILGCWAGLAVATVGEQVPPTIMQRDDWARLMKEVAITGVFVLWEPDSRRLQASDSVRARVGFLPASTFKIFNSLVALQTGAVPDEHAIIPWDGVIRQNGACNEDMDMATAIERSCVPWYQEAARRAGPDRMQHFLDTAHYGNQHMDGPIDKFWLQGALRITALQQVQFLERLDREQLPFDPGQQRTVKRILPADSTSTWHIRGKTGWGGNPGEEIGWYIGWVERERRTAYFAFNMDMNSDADAAKRIGMVRKLLLKDGWLDKDALR